MSHKGSLAAEEAIEVKREKVQRDNETSEIAVVRMVGEKRMKGCEEKYECGMMVLRQ
jgi:hypothetical protein